MIEQPSRTHQQEADTARLKERERHKLLAQRTEQLRALWRADNVLGHAHARLGMKTRKWDSHPWLLGTKQGVIDLRTGILRAGQPDDHVRALIPTAWKGLDEPAPRFMQFLREIFGDRAEAEREELIAFLQRALGYGITGNVKENVFLMLYSEEGCNEKDMLMHTLEYVLGKAVGAVSSDVLMSTTPETTKSHLSSLQGKRIAWASESSREPRFAIEQIKQLTSGGEIVARQLYTREYAFSPSHLLILLTNYRPEADAADSVFWERLCPLVFNVRFVEKPKRANERLRDPQLSVALEAEASGILAWLVRGALEWTRLGLAIPKSVRKVRQEYRCSESSVPDFVDQCCVLVAEARTPANLLYKHYKRWASDNDLTPVNNKQFARELKQVVGVSYKKRAASGNMYAGIRLCVEHEAE
ncbi:MAG TPA: phage/plasmid primase, P4 family [Ktedonobacteraceae bacterium]